VAGTQGLFQTQAAQLAAAVRTDGHTGRAGRLLTNWAGPKATEARGFVASMAVSGTLAAVVVPADLAPADLVGRHHAPALVAGGAVPVVQRDVRRLGVVGHEDRPDEREHVAHAAGVEGRAYGRARVARTQPLLADVRVGDRGVAGGWVRIEGHDPVRDATQVGQALDLQVDLERAEVDTFQFDRLGDDTELAHAPVVMERAELVLGLLELGVDLPKRRAPLADGLSRPLQAREGVGEFAA